MRVRDLIRKKGALVTTIEANRDVGTAARLLMVHNIGGLPVVSGDGSPIGFVAERDIVRAIDQHGEGVRELRVDQVMRRPAPACSPDDSLYEVMARMTRERLRHLVVLDGGRAEGVISVGDLVKDRLEQLETEVGILRDYVAAQRAVPR